MRAGWRGAAAAACLMLLAPALAQLQLNPSPTEQKTPPAAKAPAKSPANSATPTCQVRNAICEARSQSSCQDRHAEKQQPADQSRPAGRSGNPGPRLARSRSRLWGLSARLLSHGVSPSRPRRATDDNDAKAMTLLGELYSNGLGVPRTISQGRGLVQVRGRIAATANAMFALAMLRFQGRGGTAEPRRSRQMLFAAAAKLGHALGRLQSRPAVYRGPTISAGLQARRRAVPRRRPMRAMPRRNMRWRRFYKEDAACRRT